MAKNIVPQRAQQSSATGPIAGVQMIRGTNVTVQSLSGRVSLPHLYPGVITPLTETQRPKSTIIPKIVLKCVSKEGKKNFKMFSLRNIDPNIVTSTDALKALIKAQFASDLEKQFDVGYEHSNDVVNIRSPDDLREVWTSASNGVKIVLWCDGLKRASATQNKRSVDTENSDDEDDVTQSVKPKKKKKKDTDEVNKAVQSIVDELKELHPDSGYTPMQFRIWAEMYNGGVHPCLQEPPTSTMFVRAGGGNTTKKKMSNTNDPLSHAIVQLASALSPNVSASLSHSGSGPKQGVSPAKIIENRSKCYKQLAEVRNMNQSGLLSDEEYTVEREAIMKVLKQLK